VARGLGHGHDVVDLHLLRLADEVGGEAGPCLGPHLLGIAEDEVDLRHVAEGLGLCLCRTSGDDERRVRVRAAKLADFLPRLAHGLSDVTAQVFTITASSIPAAADSSRIASVS
jgi:hypothetical protein